MDKISLDRIKTLHPLIRVATTAVLEACEERGIKVRVTQALRSWAEQDALYEQGRTTKGLIVTQARGGQSWHNYGLAWDFCLLSADGKSISFNRNLDINGNLEPDWMEVVNIAKANGFEWGGDWKFHKDYPHFENRFDLTISQARSLYMAKSFDDEGYIII